MLTMLSLAAKKANMNNHSKNVIEKALKRAFAPEFLNRIDDIVLFNNLEKKDYPPMLVTTSLFDNRVLYSEPVKYIAKLRDLKTDNNNQLLKCKMEAAGHGGMSGRDNAITELSEEYSFILK